MDASYRGRRGVDADTVSVINPHIDTLGHLKAKDANEVYRKLDYYIKHALWVGGHKRKPAAAVATTPAKSGTPATRDPAHTGAIRQWAADEGYVISNRGRIPSAIEEAFKAAH